jgi:hypothetical protein
MPKMNFMLILIGLFFMLFGVQLSAQNRFVNYDIDTNISNISVPLKLWIGFLETEDDSLGSEFWNRKEVTEFGVNSYFVLENELQFGTDNYLKFLGKYCQIKVLRINKVGEYYKITSLMEFVEQGEKSNVQYIFHVYVGKENNEWKLFNPLPVNTQLSLQKKTVGIVNYYCPKYQKFDNEGAIKQSEFLEDFAKNMGVEMDTMNFYYANIRSEIGAIKGLDFSIGVSGEERPTGKVYNANTILCNGAGAYYPHELIHLLLNPNFPKCHWWINEGVATYFGMSAGKPLDWHLRKLNIYLQAHPEIDLNNMLMLRSLDSFTDYRYVLGGLLVQLGFEKNGYDGVKRLMNGGKSNDDFYNVIETELGLRKGELNTFIRSYLKDNF